MADNYTDMWGEWDISLVFFVCFVISLWLLRSIHLQASKKQQWKVFHGFTFFLPFMQFWFSVISCGYVTSYLFRENIEITCLCYSLGVVLQPWMQHLFQARFWFNTLTQFKIWTQWAELAKRESGCLHIQTYSKANLHTNPSTLLHHET